MGDPTNHDEAEETQGLLAKMREKQFVHETLAQDTFMYGPESELITPSLERLGRLERDLGDVAGARERFARALDIEEASIGPAEPATVRCREELERTEGELRAPEEAAEPG